ncbi:[acyl-carrier-protein] S-malonyltransferase [Anaerosolibacter carboniphilus]|uniref:Malonyl CoA-acyl carrier protein transacylase n=1 Tax=Anaerosolibacter carboniphilus TaxID=1417629 RepID=A0A841L3V9_9FIRM|nr:ACP S-malonyltransferase [Anaerosolibacter carboniphilus]MBB6217812.1 [acyl-carrier-protein] S-malonyltransferase [Anaerosolibacter carboniphilus]
MGKVAFVFPGQGAQYVGMGKDIVENYNTANEIFDLASNAVGYDMKKLCFEGPEEELKKTENTQPSILTTCIAMAKVLEEKGLKADITAGLSLGEYASLVIAGVLKFEDAVALVKKRGKYMQEAVPIGKGTMAAILGMERDALENALEKAKPYGIVEAANFNSPGQIVISGEVEAVEKACEYAKEFGALKAVILPVSAPFHCSMLVPAGEKLAIELDQIDIDAFNIPVIANANADYYGGSSAVKGLLVEQVSKSVLWEDTVDRMLADGVDTFIEIGPGKSLSQFIKKITKKSKESIRIFNVEDKESLENVIENLSTK